MTGSITGETPLRVWIDTDPAITSGNGEVDDGFALLQALHSPELEIVGISAVFGNTDLANTYPMAQEIVTAPDAPTSPFTKAIALKANAAQMRPPTPSTRR